MTGGRIVTLLAFVAWLAAQEDGDAQRPCLSQELAAVGQAGAKMQVRMPAILSLIHTVVT